MFSSKSSLYQILKRSFIITISLLILAAAVNAAEYYYPECSYSPVVYVADDMEDIIGVYITHNRTSIKAQIYEDEDWRKFFASMGFIMMHTGADYHSGSSVFEGVVSALSNLAADLGKPELKYLPTINMGQSASTCPTSSFQRYTIDNFGKPRAVAIYNCHAYYRSYTYKFFDDYDDYDDFDVYYALTNTPTLFTAGEEDESMNARPHDQYNALHFAIESNAAGAPFTISIDQGAGHNGPLNDTGFAFPYFLSVIKQRIPESSLPYTDFPTLNPIHYNTDGYRGDNGYPNDVEPMALRGSLKIWPTGTTAPAGTSNADWDNLDSAGELTIADVDTYLPDMASAKAWQVFNNYLTNYEPAGGKEEAKDIKTVGIMALRPKANEESGQPAVFAVVRTRNSGALTVTYSVDTGSGYADEGTDFTNLSGSITIPDGEYGAKIYIKPIPDDSVEGDETIGITLTSNTSYYRHEPYSSSGLIYEDESATAPKLMTNYLDPHQGKDLLPTNSGMSMQFDKYVQFGSGNISIYEYNNDSLVESFDVSSSAQLSISDYIVNITPSNPLDPSTVYYITVDATAIDDTSGTSFAGFSSKDVWNFKTIYPPNLDDSGTYYQTFEYWEPGLKISLSPEDTGIYNEWEVFEIYVSSDPSYEGERALKLNMDGGDYMVYQGADGSGKDGGLGYISFKYFNSTWDGDFYGTVDIDIKVGADDWFTADTITAVDGSTYEYSNNFGYSSDNIQVRLKNASNSADGNSVYFDRVILGALDTSETAAPWITERFPTNGASDAVSPGSNIVIYFSEDIAKGSGNVVIKQLSDDSVVESIDVNTAAVNVFGNYKVSINPSSDIMTEVYIEIDAGAFVDTASSPNSFAGLSGSSWSFLPDIVGPSVESVSPADGSTEISTSPTFEIDFNEKVAKGSGNIYIKKYSDDSTAVTIPGSSSKISISNDVAKVEVTNVLEPNVRYYVEFDASAFTDMLSSPNDSDGLSGKDTWDFTTINFDNSAPVFEDFNDMKDWGYNINQYMRYTNIESDTYYGSNDQWLVSNITIYSNNDYKVYSPKCAIQLDDGYIIYRGDGNGKDGGVDKLSFYRRAGLVGDDYTNYVEIYKSVNMGDWTLVDLFTTTNDDEWVKSTFNIGESSDNVRIKLYGDMLRIDDFRLFVDTDAPVFSDSIPADGATGVGVRPNLTLVFDEPVQKGTGNIYVKQYSDDSTVETVDVSSADVDVSGSNVSFTLGSALANTTQYYVEVDAGAIKDAATTPNDFGGISSKDTFDFTTSTPDTTDPTLSSSTPADGAVDVLVDSDISLTFSENILKGSGNITIKVYSNDSTIEALDVSSASVVGDTLTISPSANLPVSTRLYILVDSTAIVDTAGTPNEYAGISSKDALDFTTYYFDNASDYFNDFESGSIGALTSDSAFYDEASIGDENEWLLDNTKIKVHATRSYSGDHCFCPENSGTPYMIYQGSDGNGKDGGLEEFSFYMRMYDSDGYISIEKSVDGGAWELIEYFTNDSTTYQKFSYAINDPRDNIRMKVTIENGQYAYIDDFRLTTPVGPDSTAPAISSLSPEDDNTSAPADTDLVISFNEPVQKGSGNVVLKKYSDDSTVETIDVTDPAVSVSSDTVTINPSISFTAGGEYYVLIDSGAFEDIAANDFTGISSKDDWNFGISSGEPVNAAEGVSFTDTDSDSGQIGGDVTITAASDESDVTHYVLLFSDDGSSSTGAPLATIAADGSADYTHSVPADTALGSHTHFIVFTSNANGIMGIGTAGSISDEVSGGGGDRYYQDMTYITTDDWRNSAGEVVFGQSNEFRGQYFKEDLNGDGSTGGESIFLNTDNSDAYFIYQGATNAPGTNNGHDGGVQSLHFFVKTRGAAYSGSLNVHYSINNGPWQLVGTVVDPGDGDFYHYDLGISDDNVQIRFQPADGVSDYLYLDEIIVSNYIFTPPVNAADGVSFTDTDDDSGQIGGDVTITAASDESDVTHYVLLFSDDGTSSTGAPLATIAADGSADYTHSVPADTALGSHTHFIVFTSNADGMMASGTAGAISDVSGGGDTTAPSVTITSGPTGDITTNETFTVTLTSDEESGYVSTGGAYSSFASTTNVSISATTTLSFYGEDTAGNVSATNSVNYTFDTTAPSVTISSGPSSDITTNEAFTVTLTSDEESGYVSTGGAYSSFASTTNVSISATTTLSFFGADSLGNVSATNSVNYTFDTTAPSVTITSGPTSDITTNEAFTVTLTSDEESGYVSTGGAYSSFASTTNVAISATTTLSFYGEDTAGNVSATNSVNYTFDTTAPSVTISSGPTSDITTNETFTVTLTSDEESGYWSFAGSAYGEFASTTNLTISSSGALKFYGEDAAGNVSATNSVTYTFDTTAPSITLDPVGGFMSNASFDVTLSVGDGSGYWSTDGSSWTQFDHPADATVNVATENVTIQYYAVDELGNTSATNSANYSVTDAPIVSVTSGPNVAITTNETFTVGLSVTEDSGYWSTNGSAYTAFLNADGASITIEDTTTLSYYGDNGSGDVSVTNSITYTFDTTAPTVTITSGPTSDITTNETFTVTLTSDEESGYVSTDGSSFGRFTSTTNVAISATTTLSFYGKDALGNSNAVTELTYTFDTTAPSVTITGGPTSDITTNETFTVTLSADEESGYVSTDGSSFGRFTSTTNVAISATTTLSYYGKDALGNSNAVTELTYTFDTTAPTVTISSGPTGDMTTNEAFTVTLSVDEESGYWSTNGSAYTEFATSASVTISATTTLGFYGEDSLGNRSTTTEVVYTISVDTTAPSVTITSGPTNDITTNEAFTVTLTSDEESGYVSTDGSTYTAFASTTNLAISETTTLSFYGKDAAGNVSATNSNTYTFDTTAPSVTISSGPTGDITTNEAFMVTLSADEPYGYVSTDGSNYNVSFANGIGRTIGETTTLSFYGKDAAGNVSATNEVVYTFDTNAPDASVAFSATKADGFVTNETFTLDLSVTDADEYGYISLDTNESLDAFAMFTDSTNVTITNSITLRYYVKDIAGNMSAVLTNEYTVDMTAPTVTITNGPSSSITTNETFTVTLSADEQFGYFSTDGSNYHSFASTTNVSISATTTLSFYGEDAAGNRSSTTEVVYTMSSVVENRAKVSSVIATADEPIEFVTDKAVDVEIYTISGSMVYNKRIEVGDIASWEARNSFGDKVAPGVYIVRYTYVDDGTTEVFKIIVGR